MLTFEIGFAQSMVTGGGMTAVQEPQPNHTLSSPMNMVDGAIGAINTVPVKVIYVTENQPVQIVDSHGRLLQIIYLRKSATPAVQSK